jgi:hypothetical protein
MFSEEATRHGGSRTKGFAMAVKLLRPQLCRGIWEKPPWSKSEEKAPIEAWFWEKPDFALAAPPR